MMTLKQLSHKPETIPAGSSWHPAELGGYVKSEQLLEAA